MQLSLRQSAPSILYYKQSLHWNIAHGNGYVLTGRPAHISGLVNQVKTRMIETSSALQEADNWSSLSEDIDAAFQTGDLKAISSKLLGMQRSLMVLSEHDDFADRNHRLGMLQDQFEALLQPKLEEAYLAHSADTARDLVVMLKDADREHQAAQAYRRFHVKTSPSWLRTTFHRSLPRKIKMCNGIVCAQAIIILCTQWATMPGFPAI